MLPRVEIARADVPGGSAPLRLIRRGAEYSIMLDGNELMNSRLSGSEEALATLSIEALKGRIAPHLLIGGLGMGFTLRAAIAASEDARITTVELVPAVIDWARGPLAEIFDGSVDHPRVTVTQADVGAVIAAAQNAYDVIMLDVDNGPDGLTKRSNNQLYGASGLRAAHKALTPGGVLAIWSAAGDPHFARRMEEAGFSVETHHARANRGKGARHTIWIGTTYA